MICRACALSLVHASPPVDPSLACCGLWRWPHAARRPICRCRRSRAWRTASATCTDGINPRHAVNGDQVALLAVQNNPDLRAVRAQHGVAQAQVLQAGLLPNPQFTGAFLPLVAGVGTTPPTTPASARTSVR